MQPLTLSLIQAETFWHDAAANREMFTDLLAKLPSEAEIAVLPEMFTTGFSMASSEIAETMDGETVGWMKAQAGDHNRVICGSVVIEEGGDYFNRFLWVEPAGRVIHYDKRHCFRMAGEHEHYAPGSGQVLIEFKGWRIRPLVCYDLRFPVWLRNRNDYDLLLCVANWPSARQHAWRSLAIARAIENLAYVAAVNITGVDGNDVAYAGGTAVFDAEGRTMAEAGDETETITVSLTPEDLMGYRERFPAWMDADDFQLDVDVKE